MARKKAPLLVGLAVGEGTGPELAEVFSDALSAFAAAAGAEVRLETAPRRYRTYFSAPGLSAADAARAAAEDAADYEAWLLAFAARGGRAVFRTAFNAQSIYRVRERLESVKLVEWSAAGADVLLVRDQAQGFYGGVNDDPEASPDRIARACEFRRGTTERVLDFALAAAVERWDGPPDRILAAYKFHVLDRRFALWVKEHAARRGVEIELFQPDTANRLILRGGLKGRVLIVGANEWVDVMHAPLLERAGGGEHDELCSRNVYLDPRLGGLSEYQTVHGSADDLAGTGRVNPVATVRAAAALLERHAGAAGLAARLERALAASGRAASALPVRERARALVSACAAVPARH